MLQEGAMAMPHGPPSAVRGIARENQRRCGAAGPLSPVWFDVRKH